MSKSVEPTDYIGRGWSFPTVFDRNTSTVTTVSGQADVQESLRILFGTSVGERVLAPDYGSELETLLFAPLSDTTVSEAQDMVRRMIQEHEPRIWLEEVTFTPAAESRDRVDISVTYVVRDTNSRASIVFPFYLSEGTQL